MELREIVSKVYSMVGTDLTKNLASQVTLAAAINRIGAKNWTSLEALIAEDLDPSKLPTAISDPITTEWAAAVNIAGADWLLSAFCAWGYDGGTDNRQINEAYLGMLRLLLPVANNPVIRAHLLVRVGTFYPESRQLIAQRMGSIIAAYYGFLGGFLDDSIHPRSKVLGLCGNFTDRLKDSSLWLGDELASSTVAMFGLLYAVEKEGRGSELYIPSSSEIAYPVWVNKSLSRVDDYMACLNKYEGKYLEARREYAQFVVKLINRIWEFNRD